jgi:hypothetical protein
MYFLYLGWAEPLLWVVAEDNTAVVNFLLSTQFFLCGYYLFRCGVDAFQCISYIQGGPSRCCG